MRKLTIALLLTLVGSTGCFVGRGVGVAYNRAVALGTTVVAPIGPTAGAAVVAPGGAVASGSMSSSVTVNGQPATATVAVGPNGMAVAAGGPGGSVSASVGVPGR